jgi:DNA-directed RNA polymerase subunit omega
MARVTVEDCIKIVPNRFKLVVVASERTRNISAGAHISIDRDNDKDTVVSLREIAEGLVSPVILKEAVIRNNQKIKVYDTPESAEETKEQEVIGVGDELLEEMRELSYGDTNSAQNNDDLPFSIDDVDAKD